MKQKNTQPSPTDQYEPVGASIARPQTSAPSCHCESAPAGVAISRKYLCLNCGGSFTPKRAYSRFCCTRCSKAWYQRGYHAARRGTACEYNEAVTCRTRACDTCGWNPDVAAARKAELVRYEV